jgi:hypothetical protein
VHNHVSNLIFDFKLIKNIYFSKFTWSQNTKSNQIFTYFKMLQIFGCYNSQASYITAEETSWKPKSVWPAFFLEKVRITIRAPKTHKTYRSGTDHV